MLEANADPRYQVALRLLLDYGIRKGALAAVKFEHFDRGRRRIVIFTKGGRIHQIQIPQDSFWAALAEIDAQPSHYLICKQRVRRPTRAVMRRVEALAGMVDLAIAAAGELDGRGAELVRGKLEEGRLLLDRA